MSVAPGLRGRWFRGLRAANPQPDTDNPVATEQYVADHSAASAPGAAPNFYANYIVDTIPNGYDFTDGVITANVAEFVTVAKKDFTNENAVGLTGFRAYFPPENVIVVVTQDGDGANQFTAEVAADTVMPEYDPSGVPVFALSPIHDGMNPSTYSVIGNQYSWEWAAVVLDVELPDGVISYDYNSGVLGFTMNTVTDYDASAAVINIGASLYFLTSPTPNVLMNIDTGEVVDVLGRSLPNVNIFRGQYGTTAQPILSTHTWVVVPTANYPFYPAFDTSVYIITPPALGMKFPISIIMGDAPVDGFEFYVFDPYGVISLTTPLAVKDSFLSGAADLTLVQPKAGFKARYDAGSGQWSYMSFGEVPLILDNTITGPKISSTLKPSGSAAAATEALRALGTTASTAAAGNDSRLGNQNSQLAAANYTVQASDEGKTLFYPTGALNSARTVTLPALSAVSEGWQFTVMDGTTGATHADTNNITIQRTGSDTFFGGGTNVVINTAYGSVTIRKVNSRWKVVNTA